MKTSNKAEKMEISKNFKKVQGKIEAYRLWIDQ